MNSERFRLNLTQSQGKIDVMNEQVAHRLAKIEAEQARQAADIAEIKGTMASVLQLLSRIDGRLDEHSRTVNALIPTRLAVVGER